MANTDDDTVIYLDPKRSESMSLSISNGDTSAGYGSFKEIENSWSDAMRFLGVISIGSRHTSGVYLKGKGIPLFPLTSFFKSNQFDEFKSWGDTAEQSFAKASEAGLITDEYKARTLSSSAMMKALFGQDYSVFKNLRENSSFKSLLEIYAFAGFVAIKRIYVWLLRDFRHFQVPNSMEFLKAMTRHKIDNDYGVGFNAQGSTQKAQQALDWLVKHDDFYKLCSKHLSRVLCEVSIRSSPPTEFPRRKDAPELPQDLIERHNFCMEKLNGGEVYEEFLCEGRLVENESTGLRLYSLNSRHYFLGYRTVLPYSISVGGNDRLMYATIPDVKNYLDRASELLRGCDVTSLKSKYQEVKADDPKKFEHWEQHFYNIEQLQYAYSFIFDSVHSIGYLENSIDDTWNDVTADLLSKLINLPPSLDWMNLAEGGPIQELESFYQLKVMGHDIGSPSQSQPIQKQPSNELVERIAVVIDKESKDNGCRITDVARLFFGDTSRLSEKLRELIAERFKDAQYARLKQEGEKWPENDVKTGKVIVPRPINTSVKYQEFIQNHWNTTKLSQRVYECKEEHSQDPPEELICYLSQGRHGPLADCEEVAQWLVENFDHDELWKLVKKRELTQKSHKKSKP